MDTSDQWTHFDTEFMERQNMAIGATGQWKRVLDTVDSTIR